MHCAGRDNPADIPSRGLTPKELATSELWMNGPDWLSDGVFCVNEEDGYLLPTIARKITCRRFD